jgi:hypothetical protein
MITSQGSYKHGFAIHKHADCEGSKTSLGSQSGGVAGAAHVWKVWTSLVRQAGLAAISVKCEV